MERTDLVTWIAAYERAWRTAGTDVLAELFTADAVYIPSPYEEPLRGLDEIARFWEAERTSHDEEFTLAADVVAVEGDTGVARIEVHYTRPQQREYRDIWIVTLDAAGNCHGVRGMAFWPEQGRVAPRQARRWLRPPAQAPA